MDEKQIMHFIGEVINLYCRENWNLTSSKVMRRPLILFLRAWGLQSAWSSICSLSVSPVDSAIGAPVSTGQDQNGQDNATDGKGDGDERGGEPSNR